MQTTNKQNPLIGLLPDIPYFRRLVSEVKIKGARRYELSRDDVKWGENNWDKKCEIVRACESKWADGSVKFRRTIDDVFKQIPAYRQAREQGDEAYLEHIRTDMLFCHFAYGFTANEYFVFRIEKKTMEERDNYVSNRVRQIFRCRMNNLLQADIFNDKVKTYEYFKPFYNREAVSVSKPGDYKAFCKFAERHPVFVKKEVYLSQGRGVELIDITNCGKSERELFNELIKRGKHILEEKIEQTSELSAFNASSVNTVRAITFNTRHGIVVPYCTLRTGRPGHFVDNGGAGGVQAGIDFDTGRIVTDGFDELGGKFTAHPASNTVFKGYAFPDWDQLKDLVTTAANMVPLVKFIGWDLAHTKKGWVIVEGNESAYVIAKQMIDDRGIRDVFEKLMDDMDLIV